MKIKELKKKAAYKSTMSICSFMLLALVFIFAACSSDDDEKTGYTVTFETDGGTPVPSVQHVTAGDPAKAPVTNPVKAGYVFSFWHLDNATTAYNFQTPVNNHITLYAQWQEEVTAEYWQVIWELNGGTWPSGDNHATQVVKGGTLAEPTEPAKSSYTFDGWYKETDLTNKVSFPYNVSSVTDNFTLYAKWTTGDTPSTGDSPYANLAEGLYKIEGMNYISIQIANSDSENDTFITDAFTWVNTNSSGTSDSQGEYVLVLDGKTYNTEGSVNELTKEYTTLTVYGKQNAVIQLIDTGKIVDIGELNTDGIRFILDGDLTLKGIDANSAALLDVSFGAIAEMKSNTKITSNRNTYSRSGNALSAGGAYIYAATLIMEDNAEISECSHVCYSYTSGSLTQRIIIGGGGVYMTGGYNPSEISAHLIMRGKSKITNCVVRNTATIYGTFAYGGGVYLNSYSELVMEDNASITSNTARHDDGTTKGGGVYISSNADITQEGSSRVEGNTPDDIYQR